MTDSPNPFPLELNSDTYINRELAWIEFNRRVLVEAQDVSNPLLERLKFLAIFSNNLDEFYMVRVAGYHNKLNAGVNRTRPDGYRPSELIYTVRDLVIDMVRWQRDTMKSVLALLEEEGIQLLEVGTLPQNQRAAASRYFEREVFPVLTPLAVDHARPFPFISNLSLSLAVWLKRTEPDKDGNEPPEEFVRIKVPEDVLPRVISLHNVLRKHGGTDRDVQSSETKFIWLEDLITENIDILFPGMQVLEVTPFRVTRNADIDYEYEQDADEDDLSQLIEDSIRERKFGPVVRLTVPQDISDRTMKRLIQELKVVPDRDVYYVEGILGTSSLFGLYGAVDRGDLRDEPNVPRVPDVFHQANSIFDVIRERDYMVHHPFDSFNPVEDFFRTAARDPNVLAIKATLYRVGKNSPVVKALMEARENDKQVAALVELKARFDEENNLEWSRAMEQKGVHVTYGVEELPVKTHAKVGLVVRREGDTVRRYVHLGTGNYNASTAKLYTDFGLFTCNEEIAEDVSRLFNRLTGYAPATNYKRLLVAPEYLQKHLLRLMDNEIAVAKAGGHGYLILKMNQLEEDDTILKLYEASQAGVKIDLIVRGLCCLRPGVPGLSENIRVMSIVGRFLEHSRVYYFHNAPEGQTIYCGSADLMRRNLLNRVEVVYPVLAEPVKSRLTRMLRTQLIDNVGAWDMHPDGSYTRRQHGEGEKRISSQEIMMKDSFGLPEDKLPPL
ncbi:MAG: polyphosphate kinase 1 [Chloroflexota bacterium]